MRRQSVNAHTQTYLDRIALALEANQTMQEKKYEPKKPGHKRFTTDYAIKWGRAQGWRLLQRETWSYERGRRRSHDLPLQADAMFSSPGGIVYVQGAGKSERASHRRDYEAAGGDALAAQMRVRFVYVEFVRDQDEPICEEWWAQ